MKLTLLIIMVPIAGGFPLKKSIVRDDTFPTTGNGDGGPVAIIRIFVLKYNTLRLI